MKHKRMKAPLRKLQIVDTAIELAKAGDYSRVTARQVADVLKITPASVMHHFATMPQLRRAIMRRAVETRCIEVVKQGLAQNDQRAKAADDELKALAVKALIS